MDAGACPGVTGSWPGCFPSPLTVAVCSIAIRVCEKLTGKYRNVLRAGLASRDHCHPYGGQDYNFTKE